MKKMTLLVFLLSLFSMLAASDATVLVFKGTATRYKADGSTSSKVSTTVYFFIQYDNTGATAGQNYFVFTSAAKKTVSLNGPRSFGFVQVGSPTAKVDFYVNGSGTYTNVFSFAANYCRFQGAPGAHQPLATDPSTVLFMKTLTGTITDADTSPLVFEFPSITMSFDKTDTQAANGAGKTAATAATDFANALLAKGYVMGS